jgi:hypothetical protein
MSERKEQKKNDLQFLSFIQNHTNIEGRTVPINSSKGGSSPTGSHMTLSVTLAMPISCRY